MPSDIHITIAPSQYSILIAVLEETLERNPTHPLRAEIRELLRTITGQFGEQRKISNTK
jgi:hypothetical protein